jgi:hypothetical protein
MEKGASVLLRYKNGELRELVIESASSEEWDAEEPPSSQPPPASFRLSGYADPSRSPERNPDGLDEEL